MEATTADLELCCSAMQHLPRPIEQSLDGTSLCSLCSMPARLPTVDTVFGMSSINSASAARCSLASTRVVLLSPHGQRQHSRPEQVMPGVRTTAVST